jgi:hypothetical protein
VAAIAREAGLGDVSADPTFLYIDYGHSPWIGRELRYSLATLLAEYADRPAQVVVYTDKPALYAGLHPRVGARDISPDLPAMTRGGAYSHRIKPCVLSLALRDIGGACVALDTDSYIEPGFADALAVAARRGPIMDHFERADPYPEASGFEAKLPNSGDYRYEPAAALMYNSGLVAVDARRDAAAIQDAIALIDALIDAGKLRFDIEQIAVSETLRRAGAPIGELAPFFQHYFRRSLKRYMHWRIDLWLARTPRFEPLRPFIRPSRNTVRIFNYVNWFTRRY